MDESFNSTRARMLGAKGWVVIMAVVVVVAFAIIYYLKTL
jgi:hypothetical protein